MFKSIPGTSEYQRKLAKAVRPGQQFRLTGGGAPTNSDDYFIGLELQHWDEEAVKLAKKKADGISAAGSKIHSHSLEPSKWGNGEHMRVTNKCDKTTLVRLKRLWVCTA